jgi:flagellar protein FlaJ
MLGKFALKLFGSIVEPYSEYLGGLNKTLKKGMFNQSVEEYASVMILVSLLVFVVVLMAGSFFIALFLGRGTDMNAFIYSYTLAIIVSVVAAGITIALGYSYPKLVANSVKVKIEKGLPFAVFYMATTASSGIHPMEIFTSLSKRKGPLGREAYRIISNVKTLGMNLTDSMARVAARTASPEFADLLWGMISVITTGGSMEEYLNMKTRSFMERYRRSLANYAKKVSFYTEIYITAVLVGSLFFIVLTAIMSPLGGMDVLMLQSFVVFLVTPMVSVAFMVLIRGSYPAE